MNCVVTGGSGFIGSNLVDALVQRGDQVDVIDSLSTGKRENLIEALARGAALHEIDVRDADAVSQVLDAVRADVVFHLAGGALYGDADVIPTPEDHAIRPLAPYGQSKFAAEGYCELYTWLHGLSSISLRYGNVYGPRQDVHGEAGVVAIFCGQLVEGRTPTVFADGQQTRDWVEVGDVVRANLLAADGSVTGPVNIGHGKETAVLELLSALDEVSEPELPEPRLAPERRGEVRRSCLDVSRARRELGGEAKVQLRDGLRRILAGL